MGIKLFSFSTNEGYKPRADIDPDPTRFRIETVHEVNNHLVAVIVYPNCTNFEGKKILVFRNTSKSELLKEKLLDPHFSKTGLAPFARFVPTQEGLRAALEICNHI